MSADSPLLRAYDEALRAGQQVSQARITHPLIVDRANAAREALNDALAAAEDWRPIETAPGDGEVFLAYAPHSQGGYMVVACLSTEGWVVDTLTGKPHPFTRWTRLPPSPEQG